MTKKKSITIDPFNEFNNLEKRMDKSYNWVKKNRADIDKNISFFDAMSFYDMGVDVTQLKISETK